MRVAFVLADPAAQAHTHGTVYLAQAAMGRGHDVAFVGIDDLTLTPEDKVTAVVTRSPRAAASNQELCDLLASPEARRREEVLDSFDVVFLRYNPGGGGGSNPAVEFGWRLQLGGTLVVNDPDGLQRAASRTYLSALPPSVRARTMVTRETAKVKEFLRALDAPAVIKPLAQRPDRPEEENVFYLARGLVKNLNQMITVVKKTGYVVVQEYLPDAAQGEKRLLLLGGEPLREGRRVAIYRRPADTVADGTAPTRSAGGRKACDFGPAEARIVEALRPRLEADGLYFVALDIVGGKVTELNVHTPGGFHANLQLHGIDVGDVVIRDLERRVAARRSLAGMPPRRAL